MLEPKRIGVNLRTVLQHSVLLLHHLEILNCSIFFRNAAEIACWVLAQLGWIEGLVGKDKSFRIVLLPTDDELPEINWSGDVHRV
jgi:hypothetical protein